MSEKDRRLAAFCAARGVEGVLLRRRSNIAWATDGADVHCDASKEQGIAAVLWTPARKVVLTDNIEAARLRDEELSPDWEVRETAWWEPPAPPPGNLATDWPEDGLAELRSPLTPREIETARALGAESAEAMRAVLHGVRRGASEVEVAADLWAAFRRRGMLLHVCLVAADGRSAAYRHPIPTHARVERTLVASVCAQRRGLIVSLTRVVHFGRLPEDLRRRHQAVCRVDEALHAATRPGTRWCDALARGVRAYAEAGFPEEWRRHHQGGPTGYEARDFRASPGETRRIPERQMVAWNPTVTGTKSEDTILSDGTVLTAMSDWPTCGSRPDVLARG